jgi:hypothetical protein
MRWLRELGAASAARKGRILGYESTLAMTLLCLRFATATRLFQPAIGFWKELIFYGTYIHRTQLAGNV